MVEYDEIYAQLDYRFDDSSLLERALTHRSHGPANYERLEFLGDSILSLVVSEWLYHRFSDLTEGKLSRMRAAIVRKDTLANVARELRLGEALILGEGEKKSGGFNRDSILADCLEAVIGAIFLDRGLDASKSFIIQKFAPHLSKLRSDSVYKDFKSRLQEYLQQRGLPVPQYIVVSVVGEPHQQTFEVECQVDGVAETFAATGASRRIAEQTAAKTAYKALLGVCT